MNNEEQYYKYMARLRFANDKRAIILDEIPEKFYDQALLEMYISKGGSFRRIPLKYKNFDLCRAFVRYNKDYPINQLFPGKFMHDEHIIEYCRLDPSLIRKVKRKSVIENPIFKKLPRPVVNVKEQRCTRDIEDIREERIIHDVLSDFIKSSNDELTIGKKLLKTLMNVNERLIFDLISYGMTNLLKINNYSDDMFKKVTDLGYPEEFFIRWPGKLNEDLIEYAIKKYPILINDIEQVGFHQYKKFYEIAILAEIHKKIYDKKICKFNFTGKTIDVMFYFW